MSYRVLIVLLTVLAMLAFASTALAAGSWS
jgi:hypothetical protein